MITEDLLRISSNQGSESVENDDANSNYTFSPGGSMYFVPVCVDENCKHFVDQIFDSLEAGLNLYKDYGRSCGYGTRRSAEKQDEDHTVIKEHNQDFVPEMGRQFMRVNREMSCISWNFAFDAGTANIGTSKSFFFMKELVGGYANVGATVRDFRNFRKDLKEYVGERDAQMIVEKFNAKKESCKSFYFAYDLDKEGHLTKLFWVDSVARRNYELYGDAVSFDATFDTNKYNMVFCPFTGIDKHEKCVTFGFALLSKEDIPHFKWAFDQFLKAIGRNPVCIITDQCPVMKQAIPMSFHATEEFPATKHRLCMWHIMEKFPVKLGNFISKETDLMEKMKKYTWSSTIEPDEFEKGWKSVLKEFKLEGNRWLWEMYAIRTSWIPAFFRDKPMFCLIRTTSRSESENNFFSQFHRQSDTLCEFYLHFESAMDKQRYETAWLNQEGSSTIPATITKLFMEAEAAQVYTRPVFYKVQQEMVALGYDMRIQTIGPLVDGIKCYEMKDVMLKDQVFKVKLLGVSDDFKMMENASLKQTNIWFSFQKSMNKTGVILEKLAYVEKTVKQLVSDLGDDTYLSKKAHIEMLMGPHPREDLTIHVSKECSNKGSGTCPNKNQARVDPNVDINEDRPKKKKARVNPTVDITESDDDRVESS
ncbi:hypothetical protein POM88_054550 [Heracleum sosnowskyi]|uniref:MULE transposase domain-containing protein n=1 Tax=Heracleum sosnowskyi TaxID=360622 RepID=A0AAD8GMJ6_9APIA|nr:hypothetical protein POM88_054550 [Heracleum sosnowskyi]